MHLDLSRKKNRSACQANPEHLENFLLFNFASGYGRIFVFKRDKRKSPGMNLNLTRRLKDATADVVAAVAVVAVASLSPSGCRFQCHFRLGCQVNPFDE